MLRIMTFNANGVRSAARKGFFNWFGTQDVDVLCVQELKAQQNDIPDEIKNIAGYGSFLHCARKKGYSGCGIWTRIPPRNVRQGFGDEEFDAEGRYVEADFGALVVISAYFPSGSSSELRQEAKYRFLERFERHLAGLQASGREIILCGDVNIAHREIDLKNWRGNMDHSGFLPEERAWLDRLFRKGWVDVFRSLDPRPDRYTWWSQRGRAREKNVGWRIDYEIATAGVASGARRTDIHSADRFSDHAPLWVDYEVSPMNSEEERA